MVLEISQSAALSQQDLQGQDMTLAGLNAQTNLTRLQLLYWIGQSFRPDVPIFSTIYTYKILGKVYRDHFNRAFQALVLHSVALRTIIEEREGRPQQRILSARRSNSITWISPANEIPRSTLTPGYPGAPVNCSPWISVCMIRPW
jgi:hypothetical protein